MAAEPKNEREKRKEKHTKCVCSVEQDGERTMGPGEYGVKGVAERGCKKRYAGVGVVERREKNFILMYRKLSKRIEGQKVHWRIEKGEDVDVVFLGGYSLRSPIILIVVPCIFCDVHPC